MSFLRSFLKEIILWLVKLLLPPLQSRVARHGNRTLPSRFLEFGILAFFTGFVLLGFFTAWQRSVIWWLYLMFMPVLILAGYVAIAFWEPDLFYGMMLKVWAEMWKCKDRDVLCKAFYRFIFRGVDEERLEIIWESIPLNIEKWATEEERGSTHKVREFVKRYFKGLTEQEKRIPLIIRAEDLDWLKLDEAHKVFAISLLSLSREMPFLIRPSEDADAKIWVDVFLKGDRLAIYSNLGKRWIELLLDMAGASNFREGLVLLSSDVHSYLIGEGKKPDLHQIWQSLPPRFSLRWASGGALLVVRYRSDPADSLYSYWAALFFRDVFPVGWNVGNGASESLSEQYELPKLCAREFCEEYVITGALFEKSYLDYPPQEVYDSRVFPVQWYPFERVEGNAIEREISPKFMEAHVAYREKVDGLVLSPKVKDGAFHPIESPPIRVRSIPTWTAVKVKNGRQQRGIHLLFSVNPFELGIETIALVYADIDHYHQIIDGEFHLGRRVLIRRPVALFNLGWLNKIFQEKGGLGDKAENLSLTPELAQYLKDLRGTKILPEIPPEYYRLFVNDIPLRQRRLRILFEENCKRIPQLTEITDVLRLLYERSLVYNAKEDLSEGDIIYIKEQIDRFKHDLKDPTGVVQRWEDVYFEMLLSIEWLYEYGYLFGSALKENLPLRDVRLRSMCPVTWKSLEYVLAVPNVLEALKVKALQSY